MRLVAAVVALTLAAPTTILAQDADRSVAGGGIMVDGWKGKVDARAAKGGKTVNDSKFAANGGNWDLKIGPAVISADRLHFDGVDQLEVEFDGFRPTSITVVVHRVTADNLSIKIGEPRQRPPTPEPPARSSSPAVPIDQNPPR